MKKYTRLSLEERIEISKLLSQGIRKSGIARILIPSQKVCLKAGGFPQVNFVGNNNKTKNLTTWKTKLNLQKNSYK